MTQRVYFALLMCIPLYACGGEDTDIAASAAGTHRAAVATPMANVIGMNSTGAVEDTSGTPDNASSGAITIGPQTGPTGMPSNGALSSETTKIGSSQSVSGAINRQPSATLLQAVQTGSPHASPPIIVPTNLVNSGGSAAPVAPVAVQVIASPATSAVGAVAVQVSASSSTVAAATSAAAPTISGTPLASAIAGSAYLFTPSVTNPNGAPLKFTIQNAPSWAIFIGTSGTLSGTPTTADIGTYSNIVITVSDGMHTANLPAFAIAVGQVSSSGYTLSWTPSDLDSEGAPLGDVAGYRVSYGRNPLVLTQTVSIADLTTDSYAIPKLAPGTWYFAVASYDSFGVTGNSSNVVEIML